MPRTLRPAVLASLLVGMLLAPSAQAAKSHKLNAKVTGAVIQTGTPVKSAFAFSDSGLGLGAGTLNLSGSTGSAVVYLTKGSIKATLTVKLAAGQGTIGITGTGTFKGGTGDYKGAKGTVTLTGSEDTATQKFTATLKGTLTA